MKLGPERPVLALSKADLSSPGGLCLLGTSLSRQAAHPSFHPILVMVFGAKQVLSVSAAGRGAGGGVHGRRDLKGQFMQNRVIGWTANRREGQKKESMF